MGDIADDIVASSELRDNFGDAIMRDTKHHQLNKNPPKPDKDNWVTPLLDVVGHVTPNDKILMEKYIKLRPRTSTGVTQLYSIYLVVNGHSKHLVESSGYISASFTAFCYASVISQIIKAENKT